MFPPLVAIVADGRKQVRRWRVGTKRAKVVGVWLELKVRMRAGRIYFWRGSVGFQFDLKEGTTALGQMRN
jgi:hypothetical protein